MQWCCQLLHSVAKSRAEFYFVQRFAQQKKKARQPMLHCAVLQQLNLSRNGFARQVSDVIGLRGGWDGTSATTSEKLIYLFIYLFTNSPVADKQPIGQIVPFEVYLPIPNPNKKLLMNPIPSPNTLKNLRNKRRTRNKHASNQPW